MYSCRSLYNNKLTDLPVGGDFTDFSIDNNLQLQNNRITRIRKDTFKNFKANNL